MSSISVTANAHLIFRVVRLSVLKAPSPPMSYHLDPCAYAILGNVDNLNYLNEIRRHYH
jgi:hypothetical protein